MAIFISHRGESMDAPENTLEAFRLSNERDVEGMESDVHFTKDGVLVCSHDFNTLRRSGVDHDIEETPLAVLRELNVSADNAAYPVTRIPLFSEALKTLKPGRKFYVEIKANDEKVLPAVKAEIERANVPWEQIVIISFQADIIAATKKYMPQVQTLWLSWVGYREDGSPSTTFEKIFETLDRVKADGLDVGGNLLTAEFLRDVKAHGYFLSVWTIDDEDRCRFCIENGADAITSNCAAKMKAAMGK